MTGDGTFHNALRRSLELAEGVEVQAHGAVAPPADVVVVDAEAPPADEGKFVKHGGAGLTIVVAPQIDEDVRERGRVLGAAAYIRKDEGLHKVIGLVIELASVSDSA